MSAQRFDRGNLQARNSVAVAALRGIFSEVDAGDVEAHAIRHLMVLLFSMAYGIACGIALP
jgi:hypothetical protein